MTWMKAFPGIVEPVENMSDEVLAHVRYPQDMFKIQRAILSRYHVTDATTFYNASDVWIVPERPDRQPGAGVPAAVLPDPADARHRRRRRSR